MTYNSNTSMGTIMRISDIDCSISSKREEILAEINNRLVDAFNDHKYIAFIYGSVANGIAEDNDSIDISIVPRISTLFSNEIATNVENNDLRRVIAFIGSMEGIQGPSLYNNTIKPYFYIFKHLKHNIELEIRFDNFLDIERTNLITEYLSLDNRVKPFISALRKFIKNKNIADEKKGYLNSFTFTMIGLYFLICVQDPPVLPCLHESFERKCESKICRFKTSKTVQGFDTGYHDCIRVKNKFSSYYSGKFVSVPGAIIWDGKNEKNVESLISEAFEWLSSPSNLTKSMTINPKNAPNHVHTTWKNDVIIFVDPFDPNFNIGDSCSAFGANIISKEFALAYNTMKKNYSIYGVLDSKSVVTRPINPKLKLYGTYGRRY